MIDEPERILAKLWHDTEGQFTREQWLDLTDWDINNWLCRPNLNENNKDRPFYWPVERVNPDLPPFTPTQGPAHMWMLTKGAKMRTLGYSKEEIAAALDKYLHPKGPRSGYKGP